MNNEAINELKEKRAEVIQFIDRQFNAEDELIKQTVLKCMDIVENLKFTPEGPSYEAKYQRTLCAHAIQKHFGL